MNENKALTPGKSKAGIGIAAAVLLIAAATGGYFIWYSPNPQNGKDRDIARSDFLPERADFETAEQAPASEQTPAIAEQAKSASVAKAEIVDAKVMADSDYRQSSELWPRRLPVELRATDEKIAALFNLAFFKDQMATRLKDIALVAIFTQPSMFRKLSPSPSASPELNEQTVNELLEKFLNQYPVEEIISDAFIAAYKRYITGEQVDALIEQAPDDAPQWLMDIHSIALSVEISNLAMPLLDTHATVFVSEVVREAMVSAATQMPGDMQTSILPPPLPPLPSLPVELRATDEKIATLFDVKFVNDEMTSILSQMPLIIRQKVRELEEEFSVLMPGQNELTEKFMNLPEEIVNDVAITVYQRYITGEQVDDLVRTYRTSDAPRWFMDMQPVIGHELRVLAWRRLEQVAQAFVEETAREAGVLNTRWFPRLTTTTTTTPPPPPPPPIP